MKTLNDYTVNDALYQGDTGPEAQVGDQVKLYLDTEAVPGFPEFIVGVIQHPISKVNCNSATAYDIEYDEDDLLGAAAFIVPGNVIDAEVISATDVLEDALAAEIARATAAEGVIASDLDDEEAARIAADAALQVDIDAEIVRATAEEADIRVDFAAADDLLQIRPLLHSTATGAPLDQVAGLAQIIRISPTGSVTVAGDALLTVAFDDGPLAFDIPVLFGDGPTEICTAITSSLGANSTITDYFTITNNGTTVDLTVKAVGGYFLANDPAILIHISDNTSTGVDDLDSAITQAGIATVDATDPVHVGRWCRVGDAAPFDWYQADTLTTWLHRFSGGDLVGFNATQSLFQKLVISGASGSEIITITDL